MSFAVKSTYLLALIDAVPGLAEKLPATLTEDRPFVDVVERVQPSTFQVIAR